MPRGSRRSIDCVRLILNVIWFIFGGLWLAIGYAFAALICFVLIITIPFGIQAFKLAGYSLWPFGREVVPAAELDAAYYSSAMAVPGGRGELPPPAGR